MKEIGIVSDIQGKKAQVIIQRSAACGDCGACQVGKNKLTMETNAVNTVGAQKGDQVEVEMPFLNVLTASLIMYGIPLLVFILGVFAGNYLPLKTQPDGPLISFLTGLLLMVLSFIVIKLFDRKGFFSVKYQPHITNILKP